MDRSSRIAIFWYFGREVEGLLGRNEFAVMLLLLTVIPGIVGRRARHRARPASAPIELAVFLVFIAEYPFARFFFGIPAWAIGAVFVGIEVLQFLGDRDERAASCCCSSRSPSPRSTARAMGLAESLPWIPKIPIPSRRRRRAPQAPAARGRSGGGEVVTGPWSATVAHRSRTRGSTLPQPPAPTSSDPHDQAELDDLLEKISANGMDGLTADEKRRLNELSKRLRNRR